MTKKVERVLGGDITTTSFEELQSKFDKLNKEISEKKYGLKLEKEQIEYLTLVFLPNLEWENRGAFDVYEMVEMVSSLDSNMEVACTRESVRALFHFVLVSKSKGVDYLHIVKNTLVALSEVVQQINNDDQLLQDAGFELHAAEQGIVPEAAVNGIENVEIENTLKSVH
jgi:hypothetical protein